MYFVASLGDISAAAILCEQTYRSQAIHLLFYNDCEHQRSGTLGYSAAAVSNKQGALDSESTYPGKQGGVCQYCFARCCCTEERLQLMFIFSLLPSMLGSRQR